MIHYGILTENQSLVFKVSKTLARMASMLKSQAIQKAVELRFKLIITVQVLRVHSGGFSLTY